MQHAHTTPSTPWRWRVILGCQAVLLMTSGAPGTAWGACMWRGSSPGACAGARPSSPLRSPWWSSSRPLPSLPTQLPRHRDRLWWLPPGTRVHTRGAPLPLSPSALTAGARSPRCAPLSHRRARRTHRPEGYALACRPRAGPWGQGGLGHPGSPPAPSRGRTERAQRRVTPPPVSAMCGDAPACAVTCARHGGRTRRYPDKPCPDFVYVSVHLCLPCSISGSPSIPMHGLSCIAASCCRFPA